MLRSGVREDSRYPLVFWSLTLNVLHFFLKNVFTAAFISSLFRVTRGEYVKFLIHFTAKICSLRLCVTKALDWDYTAKNWCSPHFVLADAYFCIVDIVSLLSTKGILWEDRVLLRFMCFQSFRIACKGDYVSMFASLMNALVKSMSWWHLWIYSYIGLFSLWVQANFIS